MATRSSIRPGKSHGQRSLTAYSPWDSKKLDMISDYTITVLKDSHVASKGASGVLSTNHLKPSC